MQQKTIKTWLSELPEGYRERAISQMSSTHILKVDRPSLMSALHAFCTWSNTKEGFDFWSGVCEWSKDSSKPLPKLPQ